MTRLTHILLMAGFAATASSVCAQGTPAAPSPAAARHQERIRAVLEVLAEPRSIANLVRFTEGYYETLLKAGFTQDQAIRIVVGAGIPRLD